MIKVLEQAIDKVKALSDEQQQYAAQLLEQVAADHVHVLSDEERRLIQEARDELDRGEFATDEQVRATYDKYRT
jgi:hypothetical protein